jgi:predicted GNAT family acetyltransferase
VEADPAFVPLLRAAFSDLKTWPRVGFAQQEVRGMVTANDYSVRRFASTDTRLLQSLDPGLTWISNTWGGPHGLAGSGFGWGAFVAGQLASVACTFFFGAAYEDIGIVTEPQCRGLGLAWACAGALCDDVRARGHRPSWTTSPDNSASLRVAEKLGFIVQRDDVLYITGVEIPTPAPPPAKH